MTSAPSSQDNPAWMRHVGHGQLAERAASVVVALRGWLAGALADDGSAVL
jgi:hypothetical protein